MNKFSLTFLNRQTQIRTNSFLNLLTTFGPAPVQYCPCTEKFSIKDGCTNWTYTFCIQDCDIPAGLSICALTEDVLVPPYLEAITIEFEDSPTTEINGAGTELNPYRVDVRIDPDPDNDLVVLPGGLFVEETGTPGTPGSDGADGASGADGSDGVNGSDGTNGTDGTVGADGAGPPVGMIFPVAGLNAPTNTQPLWGQLLNRISFPELWAFALASGNIIDDATWTGDPLNVGKWSSGDGVNTFRLPNLRGYFLRPWNSDDGGLYPDDDRDFASVQGDAIRNIVGNVQGDGAFLSGGGAFLEDAITPGMRPVNSNFSERELTFDASAVVPTADENRPKNIAYMYVVQSASIV